MVDYSYYRTSEKWADFAEAVLSKGKSFQLFKGRTTSHLVVRDT